MQLFKFLTILAILFSSCSGCGENKEEKNNDGSITYKSEKAGRINTVINNKIKNKKARDLYLKSIEFEREENFQKAKDYLLEANKIESTNTDILNSLGLIEMRFNNFDTSEKYFKEVIKHDSTYYSAYTNMGLMYYYHHKYEVGIKILKSTNYQKASSSEITSKYFHLFMNYTGLHNCDSAYHYYLKVTETNKNNLVKENIERFKSDEFDPLNCN